MKKFIPEIPKTKRKVNEVVSIKIRDEETRKQFYDLCSKTGLAPSRLGYQMLKFALDNM